MTFLGNGEHMNEPGGNQRGEPVTYREYMEGQRALQTQITELRLANERFAHLPEKFDKFTETVTAELRTLRMQHPQPSAPQTDSLAQAINAQSLAMQRMFDTMSKQPPTATTATELLKLLNTPPPGSSGKTWALVGVLATVAAFMAYRAFTG